MYETYVPVEVRLPYQEGALISMFHEMGQIERIEHGRGGVDITGRIPGRLLASFSPWLATAQKASAPADEDTLLEEEDL